MDETIAETASLASIERSSINRDSQVALTTEGQRRVNLIWEFTQAAVAIMVVGANILVWVHASLTGSNTVIPEALSNSLFLVIGFYFSRTNHQAIGGVGHKPPMMPYDGR